MRHKPSGNALLRVVVLFIAVLSAFTAPSALTQVQAARKPVWQWQVLRARVGVGRIGSTDVFRAQTARNGLRAMSPASLYSFLEPAYYSDGGSLASSVVAADLNGDGKPDLVVADCGAGGNYNDCGTEGNGLIGVLLGKGDGTFGTAVTYDSGGHIATSVSVADVNGDGKPDVIAANYCFDNSSCPFQRYSTVGVLLGNGDGTFQPPVDYDSGGVWGQAVAVADVNGDGKRDLVMLTNGTSLVGVLLGNGDGTFQPAVTYDTGGLFPESLSVVDVNRDGKLDVIVANCTAPGGTACNDYVVDGNVSVLLGNGDGTFQPAIAYDSGAQGAWSIAVADVNGDHRPDVLVVHGFGGGFVLLGKGDGTFKPAASIGDVAIIAERIAAVDVNGDGAPDVLIAGSDFWNGKVEVLLNNTPFCTTPPAITLSASPVSLWPPNGKMVPVTISGTITDTGCTVTATAYAVTDEYGKVQPSGPVTLSPGGAYSFTVLLEASRLGTDIDGRLYTVLVSATNNAGKTGSQAGTVMVPHDQGH